MAERETGPDPAHERPRVKIGDIVFVGEQLSGAIANMFDQNGEEMTDVPQEDMFLVYAIVIQTFTDPPKYVVIHTEDSEWVRQKNVLH